MPNTTKASTRTSHTPGPWDVNYPTDEHSHWCNVVSHGGWVASIPPTENIPDLNERQANARLIAAAPDLLEAAQDTLTRLEWWAADPETRTLDAGFAVLRTAIHKATGEA